MRWEYQTAYAENWRKDEVLGELGAAGWEVFAINNRTMFLGSMYKHGIYLDYRDSNSSGGVWVFECKRPALAAV
jgi:hypothetical protein